MVLQVWFRGDHSKSDSSVSWAAPSLPLPGRRQTHQTDQVRPVCNLFETSLNSLPPSLPPSLFSLPLSRSQDYPSEEKIPRHHEHYGCSHPTPNQVTCHMIITWLHQCIMWQSHISPTYCLTTILILEQFYHMTILILLLWLDHYIMWQSHDYVPQCLAASDHHLLLLCHRWDGGLPISSHRRLLCVSVNINSSRDLNRTHYGYVITSLSSHSAHGCVITSLSSITPVEMPPTRLDSTTLAP